MKTKCNKSFDDCFNKECPEYKNCSFYAKEEIYIALQNKEPENKDKERKEESF